MKLKMTQLIKIPGSNIVRVSKLIARGVEEHGLSCLVSIFVFVLQSVMQIFSHVSQRQKVKRASNSMWCFPMNQVGNVHAPIVCVCASCPPRSHAKSNGDTRQQRDCNMSSHGRKRKGRDDPEFKCSRTQGLPVHGATGGRRRSRRGFLLMFCFFGRCATCDASGVWYVPRVACSLGWSRRCRLARHLWRRRDSCFFGKILRWPLRFPYTLWMRSGSVDQITDISL